MTTFIIVATTDSSRQYDRRLAATAGGGHSPVQMAVAVWLRARWSSDRGRSGRLVEGAVVV